MRSREEEGRGQVIRGVQTLSLSRSMAGGGAWRGLEGSSVSELLDPDDDTLIWSAWVFLPEEVSAAPRSLQRHTHTHTHTHN